MTRLRPADATSAYKSYLRRLSDMLDDKPYLLGEVPCIADFSVYHPLWYTRRIDSVRGILDLTPAVVDWMDRMAAIGHGSIEKSSSDEAIAIAKAGTPHTLLTDSTFQDDHGIALGTAVTIRAESFGLEETPARWWPPRARTTRWSAATSVWARCTCTSRASAMC